MNPVLLASVYLLKLALSFFLYLLILRLWLQKFRANVFNPVSRFVIQCTNPVIKPLRFIFPGVKGFDLAIIFMMILTQWLLVFSLTWLAAGAVPSVTVTVVTAIFMILSLNLNFFVIVVIASAILSWFSQTRNHPIISIVSLLAAPLLSLVRRYIPLVGGVDISPIVVIIGFHLLTLLVLNPLASGLLAMVG